MRLAYAAFKSRLDFFSTITANVSGHSKKQMSSAADGIFNARFTLVSEQLGLLNGMFQSIQEASWNNAQVTGSRTQAIINFAVTTVFSVAGGIFAGISAIPGFEWLMLFLPIIQAVQTFVNASLQYFVSAANSGFEMELYRDWDDLSAKDDWWADFSTGSGGTNPGDNDAGLAANYDHDYTTENFNTFRDGITAVNPRGYDFNNNQQVLFRNETYRLRDTTTNFLRGITNSGTPPAVSNLIQSNNIFQAGSDRRVSEEEYLVYQAYRQDLRETGGQLWTFLAIGRHQSKGRYFDTDYVDKFNQWIQKKSMKQFLIESYIYSITQYIRSLAGNIGNMTTSDNVMGNYASDEINQIATHYMDQMSMVTTWQEYKNAGNDMRFFGDKAYDRDHGGRSNADNGPDRGEECKEQSK